jgi:hypothetical protein
MCEYFLQYSVGPPASKSLSRRELASQIVSVARGDVVPLPANSVMVKCILIIQYYLHELLLCIEGIAGLLSSRQLSIGGWLAFIFVVAVVAIIVLAAAAFAVLFHNSQCRPL